MAMISTNQFRFDKRELPKIISREIIKPSSPTPSHLKTYNLTVLDQVTPSIYVPIVTFYPNTGTYHNDKMLDLKKSLSQIITRYYPFAGRYNRFTPAHVDCNDNGAEFFEASIDTTLSDFLQNSHHEDLDQLFPHGLNYSSDLHLENEKVIPLMVQVNHFECGGVAVALSMSHKIGDGMSVMQFMDDWAKLTRENKNQEIPNIVGPEFISFEYNNIDSMGSKIHFKGAPIERSKNCVTRSFMFPASKINDLKLKVKAMTEESGHPITDLTRVEVVNWLLYKCAVAAAMKNNSGSFKPTGFFYPANIRQKMVEPLPKKSVGNFLLPMEIVTDNESELKPESFIGDLKKQKMLFQGLTNIETVFGFIITSVDLDEMQRNCEKGYAISSLCGYPAYEIDFGWGNPVKATIAGLKTKNFSFLMDAPNSDGIEAIVCLEKQDMEIFQSDPELLAFI